MIFTRILGALALSFAFAMPAAAARINLSATVFADPGDPIFGFLGGEIFAATSFEFSASGHTSALIPAGPGLDFHSDQTSVTIVGEFGAPGPSESRTVNLIAPMQLSFDGLAGFTLGYFADPVPLVTATAAAPVLWDPSGFAPTPALFTVIDWTLLNPTYLATTSGQLSFEFGPGVDAMAPGVLSASVSAVPLPAAAPMLLAAVGLLGLGRLRRRV